MVEQSKKGLDNLMKTYQNCDMLTIIPVLNMYKDLLNTCDVNKIHPEEKAETIEISEINKNIDQIFFNISTIYTKEIIDVVFHILQLLKKETNRFTGMTGEMNLSGKVTKIGGLVYKLIGAKYAGIKNALVPKENEVDIIDIKKDHIDLFDDNFKYTIIDTIEDAILNTLL